MIEKVTRKWLSTHTLWGVGAQCKGGGGVWALVNLLGVVDLKVLDPGACGL